MTAVAVGLRAHFLVAALAVLAALVMGAMIGAMPLTAVTIFGGLLVCALAFLAPVTHLTLLLLLTVVVPYSVQNSLTGPAGGVPSDAFLLTGLLRAAVALLSSPLDLRRAVAAGGCILFIAGAFLQLLHGLRVGADLSVAGAEFRQLLSYGTVLIAVPILTDPKSRARLLRGLLLVGLALGLFGVAQWFLKLPFGAAGDVGVREGVRLTTGGRGQVQGGLFGFPVAVAVAYAALASAHLRAARERALVLAVLGLNAAALLLTFERTFWVGAIAAIGFVTLRLAPGPRLRAVLLAPLLALVGFAALAVLAPAELVTARERLLSINQYGSDNSLRYRLIESEHVLAKIRERPVVGWGLGDTIWWGRPYAGVLPSAHKFSHNGYLWLAWKIGIPLTLIISLLIVLGILWRGPPSRDRLYATVRIGCQAALFALALINITWPSLRTPAITPVIGLLIAVAASPNAGRADVLPATQRRSESSSAT